MSTIHAPPVLEARGLAVGYAAAGKGAVQSGIDAGVYGGEFVCMLGPNGAGKSTLLRTLAGLQEPLGGQVLVGGQDLCGQDPADLARKLSLVLTERAEVGALSVFALAALGRHPHTGWSGRLGPRDRQVVHWALEATGCLELAARDVSELSDGERQKVMVARALAQEPDVILLDEPTAFLDLPRRVELMRLLGRLAREKGVGVLLTTHDLDLALRLADRLWLLPQGGPLHAGMPEDLVLGGAFERTFAGMGPDLLSGVRGMGGSTAGTVGVAGHGAAAEWTRHALERLGWQLGSGRAETAAWVEVATEEGRHTWFLHRGSESRPFGSIAELVDRLQESNSAEDRTPTRGAGHGAPFSFSGPPPS